MSEVAIDDIAEIFEQIIDLSGIQITNQAVLGDDIPVDSKDMLRILSRIESKYKFRFDPRTVLSLNTVGDLMEAIRCG